MGALILLTLANCPALADVPLTVQNGYVSYNYTNQCPASDIYIGLNIPPGENISAYLMQVTIFSEVTANRQTLNCTWSTPDHCNSNTTCISYYYSAKATIYPDWLLEGVRLYKNGHLIQDGKIRGVLIGDGIEICEPKTGYMVQFTQ